MTNVNTAIEQSLAVWEEWNGQGVESRVAMLRLWAESVAVRGGEFTEAADMIRFQCDSAESLIAKVHALPGPTGETNELYTAGRGTFAIVGDSSLTATAFCGQLSAALLAGNCAIAVVEEQHADRCDAVLADLVKAGCSDRVAVRLPQQERDSVLDNILIAGVAITGNADEIRQVNRRLALRDGVLTALVAETDAKLCPVIGSPSYILRFVTERTRTINITAVGGNATLLELGSGEH